MQPSLNLKLSAWAEELCDDPDRQFILDGIEHGFNIIDKNVEVKPVELPNHASCYIKAKKELVHKQVLHEIESGNYIVTPHKPKIVSPLGAVDKPDGGIRLIHDCSMPAGGSVNDYASLSEHYKFETVDYLTSKLKKDMFMGKVDIKSAYRHVAISAHSQQVTGLKWKLNGEDTYLIDTKLPFGARLSPIIFHRITQAVKRMMERKGYDTCVYIDDFVTIATSQEACVEAMNCLIFLLRKLGFAINWNKVVGPTQQLVYLGIEIDTVHMCLRLPDDKLVKIRSEIQMAMTRQRLSKRQLQSLAGLLNFAAAVVKGGRVFLRRCFDTIAKLKNKTDRVKLQGELLNDFIWWHECLTAFNGVSLLLHEKPIRSVLTDASSQGAGFFFEGDWGYLNWQHDWPQAASLHINCKETLAVVLAACRWAPLWRNHVVYINSDNKTTVSALNKGTCRNKVVMEALRVLFWLSATFNFKIKSLFVPTSRNLVADCISRLHTRRFWHQLPCFIPTGWYGNHMSLKSFITFGCRFGNPAPGISTWVGL